MALNDLIKNLSGSGDDEEAAKKEAEAALAAWEGLETPDYKDVDLTGPEYAGDVEAVLADRPDEIFASPIEAAEMMAETMGPSAMEGISTDPRLREAQLNALSSMEGIAEDGMNAQDKANMSRMISQVNQQDRGRREAIDQQMARRGMGGSGMDLLSKLQSSQSATDRSAQQGLDIQGMAQARALEAMMQSGQLGGAIRGQDFGEQSSIAQAQDNVDRFNTGQRQSANQTNAGFIQGTNQFNSTQDVGVQGQNVGNNMAWSQNQANTENSIAQGNQGLTQGVMNTGADAKNQTQMHNNFTIPKATFGDAATKASGVAGGHQGLQAMYAQKAAADKAAFTGAVSGAATIAGGVFGGPAGAVAAGAATDAVLEEDE